MQDIVSSLGREELHFCMNAKKIAVAENTLGLGIYTIANAVVDGDLLYSDMVQLYMCFSTEKMPASFWEEQIHNAGVFKALDVLGELMYAIMHGHQEYCAILKDGLPMDFAESFVSES